MALSFPTSPTSGQVYAAPNGVSYTWNSTVGVWTASAAGSGGSVAAWVNFDSAGAIRNSANVASVVKTGTGRFTINFSTPLASATYIVLTGAGKDSPPGGNSPNIVTRPGQASGSSTGSQDVWTNLTSTSSPGDFPYNDIAFIL
jgi:hypothetical protein